MELGQNDTISLEVLVRKVRAWRDIIRFFSVISAVHISVHENGLFGRQSGCLVISIGTVQLRDVQE